MKQILEQLCLPRVPDPRAGRANIGHRQQIERSEPALGPYLRHERCDDIGIAGVLLLRGQGHGQMLVDEPGNELGVFV